MPRNIAIAVGFCQLAGFGCLVAAAWLFGGLPYGLVALGIVLLCVGALIAHGSSNG